MELTPHDFMDDLEFSLQNAIHSPPESPRWSQKRKVEADDDDEYQDKKPSKKISTAAAYSSPLPDSPKVPHIAISNSSHLSDDTSLDWQLATPSICGGYEDEDVLNFDTEDDEGDDSENGANVGGGVGSSGIIEYFHPSKYKYRDHSSPKQLYQTPNAC
jgi:hypothetical protein